MENNESKILDTNLIKHGNSQRRRSLLPWWIKTFTWIFLVFDLIAPVVLALCNKRFIILSILISIVHCNLSAQNTKKFAPVKVITNNGDSTFGFIKVNGFFVGTPNAKLTVYNNEKDTKTYYPADIKSFSFNDRYFEAVYLATPACIYCRKDVFLERMEQGKIDLFFYYDCHASITNAFIASSTRCINYYYIRKNQNDTLFLTLREREGLSIVTQPNNFKDFCAYFKDNDNIYNGLVNKHYRRQDIDELVRAYNSGLNPDSLLKQDKTPSIDKVVLPSSYDMLTIEDYYVKLNEILKKEDIFCKIDYNKKVYSDGKIRYQGYTVVNCDFNTQISIGVWLFYNKNGTLKRIEEYNQFGEKNGSFKFFNENGELINTVYYKNDKRI